MEDYNEFVKVLKSEGFVEVTSGRYEKGDVALMFFGLGPYKINCYLKKEIEGFVSRSGTWDRTPNKSWTNASLEEVYDLLPDSLKEFLIYEMDAVEPKKKEVGFMVNQVIGMGIYNPRGLKN